MQTLKACKAARQLGFRIQTRDVTEDDACVEFKGSKFDDVFNEYRIHPDDAHRLLSATNTATQPINNASMETLPPAEERAATVHQAPKASVGYHLAEIPRGVYGELSKIREELAEAEDADNQQNPVMVLVELSDMLGAVRGYLEKHHPSITLSDLASMSDATHRAFTSGARKARE